MGTAPILDPIAQAASHDALQQRSPRTIYASAAGSEAVVGAGTSARASMIPAGTPGSSLLVRAGTMPVGSSLRLEGTGLIGALTANPGAFNLIPWVQPLGGTKVDLPGFSQAPLLGSDGFCALWLQFIQTTTGILMAGVTTYGVSGMQCYSITINAGTLSTMPAVIASDPAVDRTFGVDGYWSTASSQNYCRPRAMSWALTPAG